MQSQYSTELTASVTLVEFELDNASYGLPISCVREIIRRPEISQLPEAVEGVIGVRDLRGTVVPILCLCSLLGLPACPPDGGRVLIVEDGRLTLGLLVNDVREVQSVALDCISIAGLDSCSGNGCIAGIARLPDRLLTILNWQCILRQEMLEVCLAVAGGLTISGEGIQNDNG